ncbi:hypothetical protein BGZ98_005920 [Dissophora globulifera]|nr:hypothetical protein BGZ98_005920 [Dissophora globulifera]
MVRNVNSGNNALELVSASIFAKDFNPQLFKGTLPKPDEYLTDTRQLAYCLALLQASPSPDSSINDSLSEATRIWLRNTTTNEDEQERLKTMATELLLEFMHDEQKDEKATAEIACIASVLESNNFRSLLGIFVDSLKDPVFVPVHTLEALDRVIQCATPGSIGSDDLTKILDYVNLCLQGTYEQSPDRVYRLTRTVSHIVDAMVNDNIKDLDRKKLRTPLLLYTKELLKSADPYIVYQATYALQALLHVPEIEMPWMTALRHTEAEFRGTANLFSTRKSYNPGRFIDSAQGRLKDASQTIGAVGDAYMNSSILKMSHQELIEALKGSFNKKQDWYPILRDIDTLLQNGELAKVKAKICNALCRHDFAFQWGVCLRLGNLAADPMWDVDSQEGAVAFLGEIYRNDTVWGQDTKVKQFILDILMRLASTSGCAKQAADRLLQEFAKDISTRKQALYNVSLKEEPSSHPWMVAPPLPSSSPLLSRIQKPFAVEANMQMFARARLAELGDPVYIAPEAKAYRQAADYDSGAGKSTFNKELERELWKDYYNCKDRILRKQKKIPIFVSLPIVNKLESDLVGRQLREAHFSEVQIQELKANREFVLICDGYDEYTPKCNLYNFNQLNWPGQWKAQMVISCRSEYLGHDYRYLFRPSERHDQTGEELLQEAVIAPFSKERIQAYIEKYVAKDASQREAKAAIRWEVKDYLRAFNGIPSLQELITNPFLLTLSIRVLPSMVRLGSSTKVTRVMLYDQFMEQWVQQGKERLTKRAFIEDDKKAFDILSVDGFSQNAIRFVKELAVAIFKNQDGTPVVEYSDQESNTWKASFFSHDASKRLLCEACPLHRNGNLHRFIHQSVLEYALARAVFEPQSRDGVASSTVSVSNADSPLFWENFANKSAVIEFLTERVQNEPVFKQQLYAFIEYSKTGDKWCIAAANAITILIRAGVRFDGEDLRGIRIPGADLRGGEFESAQLQGADLRNANLRDIWLRQANLSNAQMSGVQFGEWPYLQE